MKLLALILAFALSGCASVGRDRAVAAGWADAGSTWAGLAVGLAEGNPLGLAALALKPLAIEQVAAEPEPMVRVDGYNTVSAIWGGAAVNNVCLVAVVLSGAVPLAPLCLIAGIGWGFYDYSQGLTDERYYAAWCAEWAKEKPGNYCLPYKPLRS